MGCGSSSSAVASQPLINADPVVPPAASKSSPSPAAATSSQPSQSLSPSHSASVKKPSPTSVIYDPLVTPFTPTSTSLQRPFPGRASVLALTDDIHVVWKSVEEVMRPKIEKAQEVKKEEEKSGTDTATSTTSTDTNAEETKQTEATPSINTSAPLDPPISQVFSSSTSLVAIEDNIIAGPFADPHVLAVIVSLASHPNRLVRLFPDLDDVASASGENNEEVAAAATSKKNSHLPPKLQFGSKHLTPSAAREILRNSTSKFVQAKQKGKYTLRLFYGGLWQDFVVDDLIPVVEMMAKRKSIVGANTAAAAEPVVPLYKPLFISSRNHTEYWMCLLEKALARIRGSYEDVCYTNPTELFRLLTGGSCETIVIPAPASTALSSSPATSKESEDLWTQLTISYSRHDLLACTTRQLNQKEMNLAVSLASKKVEKKKAGTNVFPPKSSDESWLHDHSELGVEAYYSILDIQTLPESLGAHRLLLLRNPLGSQKWCGAWSDGSEEWKELEEKIPDGGLYAMKLRMIKRRHQHFMKEGEEMNVDLTLASTKPATATDGTSASPTSSPSSGVFWLSYTSFLTHFKALFISQVLADTYDVCLTQTGEWKGDTAQGRPNDLSAPILSTSQQSSSSSSSSSSPSSSISYGNFLSNPQYRLRNTSSKKSSSLTITLSKSAHMCNQANAAPASMEEALKLRKTSASQQISIGFRILSNQLNHTLNCNPPTASPLFGVLQASPLSDEFLTSKFSVEDSVSLTIPSLPPYTDYFLIPYTAEQGVEGGFVLNLWTNSTSILFDACPPSNSLSHAITWSKRDRTAAGNVWSESYLKNPIFLLKNESDEPVKLLLNLTKTNVKYAEMNCNLSVLVNSAPNDKLSVTGVGMMSAPPKVVGGVVATTAKKVVEEKKDEENGGAAADKKKSNKPFTPVLGSLSPFYTLLETTRTSPDALYSASKSYPLILSSILPGKEYYIIPSTFTIGTEAEALLQIYGGVGFEKVRIERVVSEEYIRTQSGRWLGASAAGPARRKKTYLNNPQFCIRHFGSAPISLVVSLTLPLTTSTATGHASAADLAVNISVCTVVASATEPNPFTHEEKAQEARRMKEVTKVKEKESTSAASPTSASASAAPSSNFSKLKMKDKSNSNKKKDKDSADGSDSTSSSDSSRVTPLTGEYELVSQTTFNGGSELYKATRTLHLFLSDVQPHRSYFVIPSTSVPNAESEFELQVYGTHVHADVRFDVCSASGADGLSLPGGSVDMTGLASRRTVALSAGMASQRSVAIAGLSSQRIKALKPVKTSKKKASAGVTAWD